MTRNKRPLSGDALIAQLPPDRRARIEARARQLIAEELTLRDLRKAHELTQTQLAGLLGIGQEQVGRIEQRTDMPLSTLTSYLEAMGGKLELVVTFPDRPPVALKGPGDVFDLPELTLTERPRGMPIRTSAPAK